MKPATRPANPRFSTGPCAKRPGWTPEVLAAALVGRSHRAADAKARLFEVIEASKAVLGMPADFRLAIVPASDTGAVECALWSLLGPRGVDVLAWENFGNTWAADIQKQLKLEDVRVIDAVYGALPDLSRVDPARDIVFAWNGTASGVRVPDGNWISNAREGLAICDATSAAFAVELPWDKLDAVTWSWQKGLGGEAQHGMLALGPRALDRLATHTPKWPMPKLFRLTKDGKPNAALFTGSTINTPSMLCVEDALDGLAWAKAVGGLPGLLARVAANNRAIDAWVARTQWVDYLARDPATRSTTSACLVLPDAPPETARKIAALLADEGAAFDIGAHYDAPPGLRLWAGPTVETADLEALFPWLDWAHAEIASIAD